MDVQKAMKLARQSQAHHDAQMQAISGILREITRKQSRNKALVHKLTLRMRQPADRQAKPFRLRQHFPQLAAARKKTDAQRKKLHAEVRSLVAAIHRTGNPDRKYISTSYVERQNLTMRMCMRRFPRLTNGFSKKIENHAAAVALYFMYYNFVRIHKTLRVTPALAAGVTDRLWDVSDLVKLWETEGGLAKRAA